MSGWGDDRTGESGDAAYGAARGDRVDVLAYDEPVQRDDGERKRSRLLAVGAWATAAVVVGAGLVRGMLLPALAVATVVVGLWAVLTSDSPAVETRYRAVPAGEGEAVVAAHEREARKRGRMRTFLVVAVAFVVFGYGVLDGSLLLGVLATSAVAAVAWLAGSDPDLPRLVEEGVDRERAEQQFELAGDGRPRETQF